MLKVSTLSRGALLLVLLFSIHTVSASQIYDNNTGTYTDDFSDNLGIPTRNKVNNNSGLIQLQNATDTTFNTPYANTGETLTSIIRPESVAKWGTVTVNANVPASTTLRFQVYGGNIIYPDTILPGNSAGFTISSTTQTVDISNLPQLLNIRSVSKSLSLNIKLLFTTSDPTYTPTVDSVVVTWLPKQGDLASTTLAISDWPKSFANIANTLHIPSSNPQVYPAFEWGTEKINGCAYPLVGNLFQGSFISAVISCLDKVDKIYSMNVDTGAYNWLLPATTYYFQSFTISNNGTIFFADYNNDSIKAIDFHNQLVKWTYNFTNGHGNDDVSIGNDGTIYTIHGQDLLGIRINVFSPNGTILSTHDVANYTPNRAHATPFAKSVDDILYFGTRGEDSSFSDTGQGRLYAFDTKTKTIAWSYPTGDISAPPIIGSDGTIYVATRSFYFDLVNYPDYSVFLPTPIPKKVFAINPNGTKKWETVVGSTTDIGVLYKMSLRSDGLLLVDVQNTVETFDNFNYILPDATTTIKAINTSDGSIVNNLSDTKVWNMIGFTDGNDGLYKTHSERSSTTNIWYSTMDYYDKNFLSKWKIHYPFDNQNGSSSILFSNSSYSSPNGIISDSRGWVYGSLSKLTEQGYESERFIKYFALSPWTLSLNLSSDTVAPGSQLSFSALSSMKQTNPLFGGSNAMQVVLDTGEKIPLAYNGLDGRGSTIWTASYTIPTNYSLGTHSYTLEASQTYLVTDIPVHFNSTTTESQNTGITRTGSFKVQQSGILFSSSGGTASTLTSSSTPPSAEIYIVTSTSTVSTTTPTVTSVPMNPVSTSTIYTISEPLTRTLRYRTWGDDVSHLQEVLAQDSSIYPEGLVTGYFGPFTRKAVQTVQEKWNIVSSSDSGYGIFGPRTLEKVREVWGW